MDNPDFSLDQRPSIYMMLGGIVAGGLSAYLFLTPAGRRLCHDLVDTLDSFSSEWIRLSQAAGRAQAAAVEGWQAFERVLPEAVQSEFK